MTDHPQPPACEMPASVKTILLNGLRVYREELGDSAAVREAWAWVCGHRLQGVLTEQELTVAYLNAYQALCDYQAHSVEAHENAPREREA